MKKIILWFVLLLFIYGLIHGQKIKDGGQALTTVSYTSHNDLFPDLATLPLLRFGVQTFQQSAYDRAGDNYDHEYFPLYTESNGELVRMGNHFGW
jgi:hypothetical protein